jgi:CheY-like chemotaxis protein
MSKKVNIADATVLLVDDDQFLRGMYAAKFAARGAKVEVADSAEEAIERLKGGLQPALLVFDIIMPGVGGYGLLETIAHEHLVPDAAIIALSNQDSNDEISRIMDLGADGHLTKANATPSEIIEKILAMVS